MEEYPPFDCFYGCGRRLSTKYKRDAVEGWDWFRGRGHKIVHVCPVCRVKHEEEIAQMKMSVGIAAVQR